MCDDGVGARDRRKLANILVWWAAQPCCRAKIKPAASRRPASVPCRHVTNSHFVSNGDSHSYCRVLRSATGGQRVVEPWQGVAAASVLGVLVPHVPVSSAVVVVSRVTAIQVMRGVGDGR